MKGIIFSSTQLRMMCLGWATSDELPLPPLGLVPGGWFFGVAALKRKNREVWIVWIASIL